MFLAFNMQVSNFNWAPFLPEIYIFSECLSVHSFREHLQAARKMPRRNRIPLEHRERIVRGFEDLEEDYLVVADTLGINRSTARGIVARYIREGKIQERPRGGRNNVRVDDKMRDCQEEIINGRYTSSLKCTMVPLYADLSAKMFE